jgi:hypothetical protein
LISVSAASLRVCSRLISSRLRICLPAAHHGTRGSAGSSGRGNFY